MVMSVDKRLELIREVGEEIVTEDELRDLLKKKTEAFFLTQLPFFPKEKFFISTERFFCRHTGCSRRENFLLRGKTSALSQHHLEIQE